MASLLDRTGPYLWMTNLLGGIGYAKYHHDRQSRSILQRAFQMRDDGPDYVCISWDNQVAAHDFLHKHGARACRRYAKAIRRSIQRG